MDGTTRPSRNVVLICYADRAVLERLVRDPGRTTQVLSSSRILTSILAIRSAVDGKGAFDVLWVLCFHPPWVQSYVCFALPMNPPGVPRSSRTIFAECESLKNSPLVAAHPS